MPRSDGGRQRREAPASGYVDPPADLEALGPDADPESVARTIILTQLSGRARSRAELTKAVLRKGVPVDVADRLLDRFAEVGLVDDTAFARQWVESRQQSRGLARRALSAELRRKGLEPVVVDAVLSEVDPDTEEQSARDLVRRKQRSMAGCDRVVQIRRLAGMLGRKGYPPALSYRIVREEVASAGRVPDDVPDDVLDVLDDAPDEVVDDME